MDAFDVYYRAVVDIENYPRQSFNPSFMLIASQAMLFLPLTSISKYKNFGRLPFQPYPVGSPSWNHNTMSPANVKLI